MEFFNKKEEVLDFQLTEYGKNLLAKGTLRPAFYAFFDDDIQYDISGSGMSEDQNDANPRIQSNTPQLKVARTRTGAETRVDSYLNRVENILQNSDPATNVAAFEVEAFEQKGKVATYPIGRSSLNTDYNASWALEVLSNPEITHAIRYLDNDGLIENIPQVDITIDYETLFKDGEFTSDSIGGDSTIPVASDSISGYFENSTIYIALRENYLMLELLENNTDFEKENFEIEVYHSGSGPDGKYIQLAFTPESETTFTAPRRMGNDIDGIGNVEYYMNVLVDDEIASEVLFELDIPPKAVSTNSSRLRLNRNLYDTDGEEPC
tara:strand:- start:3899 stop:4864 length:966 start_codon:yes stop_codon:yes gene_type:complete